MAARGACSARGARCAFVSYVPHSSVPSGGPLRHRSATVRAVALVPLAAALACSDAPSGPAPTAPLTLCASEWMAYRNEGGAWTRAVADPDGKVRIDATARLAIASASGMNTPNVVPHLRVDFLTAEQARVRFLRTCGDGTFSPTSGTFSGVAQGIVAGGWADVRYGGVGASTLRADNPRFTLSAFDGARDLVATRWPSEQLMPDHADRVILRRAQRYTAGSSIALDFASDEAFPLAQHTVSWTGPRAHLQVNLLTADGNDVVLQSSNTSTPGIGDGASSTPLHSIPAARLAAGDLHQLMLGGGRRSVWLYYHEPRDRAVTFGPPASQPRFVTVGTSPNVRLRVEVPSQPEYGTFISASLSQFAVTNGYYGATNRVYMTATREYFGGTPRTWILEMPELSRVPGFQNVFGLHPGAYEWGLTVTSSPYWFRPSDATGGTTIRYASGSGEATAP